MPDHKPTSIKIRKSNDGDNFQSFLEFPWRLYKDDPHWVPPLVSQRKNILDRHHNPAWDYMEGDYFTAWNGEEIVGTIAAFVNHRHNEHWHEHIAWFGMFECINDVAVAQALLNTAYTWAKDHGYDALRGPQSFTTHEECGLLIENFNNPVILMPYNPPYYQTLVENEGFTKVMDVLSFYYDRKIVEEIGIEKKLAPIVDRVVKRSGITIRRIDGRRKQEEFEALKNVYNAAWSQNWGFVPMTERELDAMVADLGQFFDPNMAFFAEYKGELVGFAMAIPDFNEVLHKVYPRPGMPEMLSLIQAGYQWKIKDVIRGARFPLMGVREEFRNKGIDMAMVYHLVQALTNHTKYNYLDSGWVLETNDLVQILHKIGAQPYKTHRFYEKAIMP